MSSCTFFGHRDTPEAIRPILENTIRDLIQHHHTDTFYVGHQGGFDTMVERVLQNLKSQYPHIRFYIVLAYLPVHSSPLSISDHSLYPFGLESVPPRYAILERNKWMMDQADYVVTYVVHSISNAAKMQEIAKKKHKHILSLYTDT